MNEADKTRILQFIAEHGLDTADKMREVMDKYDLNEAERHTVMGLSKLLATILDSVPPRYELALHDIQLLYIQSHKEILLFMRREGIIRP